MDAHSSPMPPTPTQRYATASSLPARNPLNNANESFNVSASFENGLRNIGTARIEIPLRTSQSGSPRRNSHAAYKDILPESPEQIEDQLALQGSQTREAVEALDTIEVAGEDDKPRGRGRPKKTRSGSASQNSRPSLPPTLNAQHSQHSQAQVPSTPVEDLQYSHGNFENLSPGHGRWWRKRKRSVSSSVFSSGGSKKSRCGDFLAAESIREEIPDSQPIPDVADVRERMFSLTLNALKLKIRLLTLLLDAPDRIQTAEELYHREIMSVSNQSDSFAEHTVASQEFPSAGDDDPIEEPLLASPPAADEEPVEEPALELQLMPEPEPQTEIDLAADHTEYMESEAGNYTDDEDAVHSQLAREEEESASRPASPAQALLGEANMMQDDAAELQNQELSATPQQGIAAAQEALSEPVKPFDGLMDKFRSGLGMLRAMDLTREQVYEVEDLMFEMRRELFKPERRATE